MTVGRNIKNDDDAEDGDVWLHGNIYLCGGPT